MNQESESLQKLTDLPEPATAGELLDRLNEQYPLPAAGASPNQYRIRTEKIVNELLASPLMGEDKKQDLRNQTWEDNHRVLIQTISNLMYEKGSVPTVNKLAKETGLSRQTVHKHLKEFRESIIYEDHLQQFRLLSSKVLVKLYQQTLEGNVKAAKIFLDAVGGVPGLEKAASINESNNYIQINNNVKIDQMTFGQLPESVQQEITSLVLRGLQTTVVLSDPSIDNTQV